MSVVVKGMKMPKNCWKCIQSGFRTAIGCAEWAKISAGRCETERAYSCPISALPDHHGRLVDADALEPDADYDDGDYWAYSVAQVCNAPTIVEPEKEE